MLLVARLSERLTNCPLIPWRWRHLGGPLNTLVYARIRKRRLASLSSRELKAGGMSVSVVLGVRNRVGHRLVNCLASLVNQTHPREQCEILVVDYGSERTYAAELSQVCADFGATHIQAMVTGPWNRAHCLNIGIRQARFTFVLTGDVDVIFAPDYLSTAVQVLVDDPLSAVYSQCLDLPEDADGFLVSSARDDSNVNFEELLSVARARSSGTMNQGIVMTYRAYFEEVRGYDEYYEVWGSEDNDLGRRFAYLGLTHRSIAAESYYLHQWHSKFEGVGSHIEAARQRNEAYFSSNHSIYRNREGWGLLPGWLR